MTYKTKKLLIHAAAASAVFLIFIFFILVNKGPWTTADYRINDVIYRINLSFRNPVPESNRILYLTITDQTYREVFNNHHFRRDVFANVISKVSSLNPEYLLIDLIFAYPSDYRSDSMLSAALTMYGNVFVPLPLTDNSNGTHDNALLNDIGIRASNTTGENEAEKMKTFIPDILENKALLNYGHVNVFPDNDGIFRHSIPLLAVDSLLIPSISLRLFMDYCGISREDVSADWGDNITLHANDTSWIRDDIVIPVDRKGRMFVPFSAKWGDDFSHLSVNRFLDLYNNSEQRSRLEDLFDGRIIVIGDVSTGISDLSNTALEDNVPLIILAAHELNTMLNSVYFRKISSTESILFSFIILSILYFLSVIKSYRYYVYSGIVIVALVIVSGFVFLLYNILIPTGVLSIYSSSVWLMMFISIGISRYKENKYIREEMIKKKYELEQARGLQLSLLPDEMPSNEYFKAAAFLMSADEVSGDYYDVKNTDDETLIVIGDVVGHGLKAGMMSLVIKTIFSSLPDKPDLKNIFSQVSSAIKKFRIEMFFLGLLLIRLQKRKMRILSAGMPPVTYYDSAAGEVKEILIKAPPIGILKFNYEPVEVEFRPGDVIIAYSDGLSELFNSRQKMLGTERIKEHLLMNKDKDVHLLKDSFTGLIKEWTAGTTHQDDITFILIKIN